MFLLPTTSSIRLCSAGRGCACVAVALEAPTPVPGGFPPLAPGMGSGFPAILSCLSFAIETQAPVLGAHVRAFGVGPPTMPSADFCTSIPTPRSLSSSLERTRRPPRVMRSHLHAYARRIYFHGSVQVLDFRLIGSLIPHGCLYAVPVRRAGILLTASFGFHLTVDTLAVRLTVPITRVCRGLPPPSHSVKHHIRPSYIFTLHAMPGTPQKRQSHF